MHKMKICIYATMHTLRSAQMDIYVLHPFAITHFLGGLGDYSLLMALMEVLHARQDCTIWCACDLECLKPEVRVQVF